MLKRRNAESNLLVDDLLVSDQLTVNGNATIVGDLTVDDITIDGSTISDAGDFILDVGGDITLDADDADVLLKDNGIEYGRLKEITQIS